MQKEASIIQILPSEFTRKVELQPYFVGKVLKADAHHVNSLIRGAKDPTQIDFLKRVRPSTGDHVEILLCPQHDEAQMKHIHHITEGKLAEVLIREVPKWPPLTKDQHKQWNHHWPTVFNQNDFEIITHTHKQTEFIESLAKTLNADDIIIFTGEKVLLKGVGGCPPKSIAHGIIKLLENWPKCDAFNEPNPKAHKLEQLKEEFEGRYYYLTGLYVMVGRKVCQMCAMALVHSRLKRLYYVRDSEHKIEEIAYNRSLNHQYALLKVSL